MWLPAVLGFLGCSHLGVVPVAARMLLGVGSFSGAEEQEQSLHQKSPGNRTVCRMPYDFEYFEVLGRIRKGVPQGVCMLRLV